MRIGRQLDRRGQAKACKQADEPPAEINLSGLDAEPGGFGKGVVVAVIAFAKGYQTETRQVVTLHRDAINAPALLAIAMGEMTDQPMPGQRHRDTQRHAPDHPGNAAKGEQQQRQRRLLQHPGRLKEAIEPILRDAIFDDEARRMIERQHAVHLPEGVLKERPAMGEEIVAGRLALRPVADVMGVDHAERPGHADEHPEIDEDALEPERRLERTMNQQPVHADRMAEADRQGCESDEDRKCLQGKRHWCADERHDRHAADPQRLARSPDSLTVHRIAAGLRDHSPCRLDIHGTPPVATSSSDARQH